MKKVNCIRLLLALSLALTLLPSLGGQARAADHIAAAHTRDNGRPYYIMVNRAMNTVTVYTLDEKGYYTVPVKAMVCSVGRQGHNTPLGTFSITGIKKQWCTMLDGTYGQYSSQFSGYYLFHSVCYSKADPGALLTEEYNMLGQRASLGCVRLQVADAKWIYDNCAAGTKVTVYDGEDPGALGKPTPLVGQISQEEDNGWEPSDPRRENPWRDLLVQRLTLDASEITLEAGMRRRLWPAVEPEGARYPQTVTWTVDDPDVASVDGEGRVTGLREGTATVTAACGDCTAKCTVKVTGQLLHFTDVEPGAWYYSDVRYAYENGIFSGSGKKTYTPEGSMTGTTMAQVLYNLAGRPETQADSDHWSSSALDWAAEWGIIDAACGELDRPLTRRELVVMLYQFQRGAEEEREDAPADPVQEAVSWAVDKGFIQGTGEENLDLDCPVTRAQAAAILRRYREM